MVALFDKNKRTISEHIRNVFKEGELDEATVVRNFRTTASDGKSYQVNHYNLDVIISVGYRVKSQRGTQFRIWATQRLKDFLVQGYAINKKRLEQKQQEVEHLKNGIHILSRVIKDEIEKSDHGMLKLFAKGLKLLDDYDHEALDSQGRSDIAAVYPDVGDYLSLIADMHSDFKSDVFAKPKDDGFSSSVNQIRQSFGETDLYPSLEEKAANLLYLSSKTIPLWMATNALLLPVFCIFWSRIICF